MSVTRRIIDPTKPAHKALSARTVLHILAPKNAHIASVWLQFQQGDAWRHVAIALGAIFSIVGWFLLITDWYASVQGFRLPLSVIGLVNPDDLFKFPRVYWWALPGCITIAQVLPKVVPGTRVLWYPATIYSGVTNAVLISYALRAFIIALDMDFNIVYVSMISSVLGLLLAVMSERIFLSGLLILETAVNWHKGSAVKKDEE